MYSPSPWARLLETQPRALAALAAHQHTPSGVLHGLLGGDDGAIWQAIARNAHFPTMSLATSSTVPPFRRTCLAELVGVAPDNEGADEACRRSVFRRRYGSVRCSCCRPSIGMRRLSGRTSR